MLSVNFFIAACCVCLYCEKFMLKRVSWPAGIISISVSSFVKCCQRWQVSCTHCLVLWSAKFENKILRSIFFVCCLFMCVCVPASQSSLGVMNKCASCRAVHEFSLGLSCLQLIFIVFCCLQAFCWLLHATCYNALLVYFCCVIIKIIHLNKLLTGCLSCAALVHHCMYV